MHINFIFDVKMSIVVSVSHAINEWIVVRDSVA